MRWIGLFSPPASVGTPDESLLPEESEEEEVEAPSAVSEELRAAEAVFAAPDTTAETAEQETSKEGSA